MLIYDNTQEFDINQFKYSEKPIKQPQKYYIVTLKKQIKSL